MARGAQWIVQKEHRTTRGEHSLHFLNMCRLLRTASARPSPYTDAENSFPHTDAEIFFPHTDAENSFPPILTIVSRLRADNVQEEVVRHRRWHGPQGMPQPSPRVLRRTLLH